jgi:hypothetical protein
MNIHFNLNLYWLLLPLAVGLFAWVFTPRADERSSSFMPDPSPLFRLVGAVILFVLVLCALLAFNLWLK